MNMISQSTLFGMPLGMQRQMRFDRANQAERNCEALFVLSENMDMPGKQMMLDAGYCEGTKADLLRALGRRDLVEARMLLRAWRIQHRALYGRRAMMGDRG